MTTCVYVTASRVDKPDKVRLNTFVRRMKPSPLDCQVVIVCTSLHSQDDEDQSGVSLNNVMGKGRCVSSKIRLGAKDDNLHPDGKVEESDLCL